MSSHRWAFGMHCWSLIRCSWEELIPKQPDAIWLGVLLEGKARLKHRQSTIDLCSGDMIFGVTGGGEATLEFQSRFRQVFVNVPQVVFNDRFIAPLTQRLGYLPAQDGLRFVFSSVLTTIAQEIDSIKADDLRPLDLSFVEFMIACSTDEKSVPLVRDVDAARADNLHRVCQTIELLLGNRDLSLDYIAHASGVTKRFIRECFSYSDMTFASYVRKRRLERSRFDLVNPLFASQSIAEICYRRGFDSPTYFSRAFRSAYGVSPREYRRRSETSIEGDSR